MARSGIAREPLGDGEEEELTPGAAPCVPCPDRLTLSLIDSSHDAIATTAGRAKGKVKHSTT